jgi:hypothetical protein
VLVVEDEVLGFHQDPSLSADRNAAINALLAGYDVIFIKHEFCHSIGWAIAPRRVIARLDLDGHDRPCADICASPAASKTASRCEVHPDLELLVSHLFFSGAVTIGDPP